MQILKNIKHASPPLNTVRVLIATLLVLAIPFLVYYLIYVRKQNEYFTERGLRSLSLIGEQVAMKVESAGNILKNGSEKFINPKSIKLKSINPKSINPNSSIDQSQRFSPEKKDSENLETLKIALGNLKDDSPQIIPISIYRTAAGGQPLGSTTVNGISADEGTLWLYLNYETQLSPEATLKQPNPNNRVVVVKAKTNFSELVKPLLTRRENVGDASGAEFQDLLIAEASTGRVFFQLDPTQVTLASLDDLPANDQQKGLEIKELDQSSNVTDIRLAGSAVKLFSEPLEISLRPTATPDGRNIEWIICGLISSESFRAEAWSVSYTLLILCAFITSLLILNWPFIKLVLIGPKDRLRTADIYFLTFSTVVVLALVTSFGLYAYTYQHIGGKLDDQLGLLATEIKANLTGELNNAVSQLTELGNNVCLISALDKSTQYHLKKGECGNQFSRSSETDRNKILRPLLETGSPGYPYFDSVAWLDRTGEQKAKWTIRAATTHYINVNTRAYFQNLRLGDFQELNNEKFVMEPIVSKTTGRNEVEISRFSNDPNWITALETRLISLMQPVLPAGFGYLVIDKNGKVLFHSDEAHHLGENFFKECDDDPALRSAVVNKNSPAFSAKYLGQDYSLLIKSIDGFPEWSLVVFRNKQTLRSAFLELLSSQSLLFFIYSIILMAAFTVFYLINRKNDRREWIWPSPQKTRVYQQSLCLMLLLSIFSVLLFFLVYGQSVVILTTLISFIAIVVFFIHLRSGLDNWMLALKSKAEKYNVWSRGVEYLFPERYRVAYVLNLGMLLVVVAILPSATYFKFAFESEMELFIKHGQFTLASGLEERNRRIKSQYAEIEGANFTSETVREPLVETRIRESWDIYDKFFFGTKHETKSPGQTTCSGGLQANNLLWLTSYLPLSNRTSIERRGLLQNPPTDGICKWEWAPYNNLIFHLDNSAKRDMQWVALSTSVPKWETPGALWWLVLLPIFVSFFAWVNFMVRKVFLLDVERPTSYAVNDILKKTFDHNLFIVLEPPYTEIFTIGKDNVHTIDLQKHAISVGWAKRIDYAHLKAYQAIVVRRFGYKLHVPSTNQQKLHLLEELLKLKKPVIVFSEIEPSLYRFSNGATDERENDQDEADRWAGVISHFAIEYAEGGADEKLAKEVAEKKEALLKQSEDKSEKEKTSKLFDFLETECSSKKDLQQIGLGIAKDEHFTTFTREGLISRIVVQAETYYGDIWNRCSPGEQLTLWHLAQDRLLSHRDPDIERLMRRGLIVRTNDLHLMNESFRQFVKSANQLAVVSKIEEAAKRDSAWNTLKVPLLIVLIAITLFMFATQRDLYTSALAGLTALTSMIPAIFKVLSLFQKDQPRPLSQD